MAAADHALFVAICVLAVDDVRFDGLVNAGDLESPMVVDGVLKGNVGLGLEPFPGVFTDANLSNFTVAFDSLGNLDALTKDVISNNF